MGQRQLLSFVRAILYNPSILILDEATSSIDSESEQLIQQAINKIVHGRTSIIIAHRLSTIKNANMILVLDKGEVIEKGTHDVLIQQNGVYNDLYQKQFLK
jgi:ATP-binding cassette subfamily B protein